MKSNEIVIEAGYTRRRYWKDIWAYRELFHFLVWRDLLVRYKQTVLGVGWAALKPFITMVVFTIVFGKLAGLPSDGAPYPILVFTALLPWQFFANALMDSSNSLINDASLITKIYFPRLIIPSSAILVSFVDLLISGVIMAALMVWYGFIPGWQILTLPFFLLITFAISLGAGFWFGALNVKYRDFRHLVPFVVQLGLFISPVGFSSSIVPDQWRLLYSLNPMVGVIDGFRWAVLGQQSHLYWPGFVMSLVLIGIVLTSGIWYFRRVERSFSDVI